MSTLAGRLLLAFATVIIVVGIVTVLLATHTTSSEIRHVMTFSDGGRMEMTDAATLRDRLAESYAMTGGWEDAAPLLGESGSHMHMMGGSLILAAPDGGIITGAPQGRLSPRQLESALPIVVDGDEVGVLYAREVTHMMDPGVEEVVGRVNRAVWLAALVATVLAFGLSLLIVRTISQPLGRVASAAASVAHGDLTARAPVAGPAEVRSVAEAFNFMADSLDRQETLRRSMLADIAHELRTPLAVMQAQIEALTDGIFPTTPEHLEPLSGQARQLTRLVDDLRMLALADAGRLDLERSAVALPALIANLLAVFARESAAGGVAITSEIPEELPPLDADPVRLRQVLSNLLSNALRHTPPGGTIQVEAHHEASVARIILSDTGEGIRPEDMPHVFERFYRADRSRSRSTGGSGLGLAIARRLTEAHGGAIEAASSPGAGTTVTLTWPLWTGAQGNPARRDTSA